MNEGINFLEPNKNTGSGIFLRRIRSMRILTIGLLFLVSVSSVILFILVAFSPLPALKRQEQLLRQTLSSSKSSIVKLSLVNSQTDAISSALAKRQAFDQPIGLVRAKLSSDVKIQQFQLDTNILQVTVESSSLKSLDTFVNGLVGYVQERNTFSKATLVDLTTDPATNTYAATVQLNFL